MSTIVVDIYHHMKIAVVVNILVVYVHRGGGHVYTITGRWCSGMVRVVVINHQP